MILALGSDHRGFGHKAALIEALKSEGNEILDFGCHGPESADYPEPALAVAEAVAGTRADLGILICGSGIGVSIAANKVRGIRASLCFTPDQARTTRRHNDSNVLCLSGDAVSPEMALTVARAWLESEFEGGRHARRVDIITRYVDRGTCQE